MREFEYFIGPQHLGMAGNFGIVVKVDGDMIVDARANPGYLHRAFEKQMERRYFLSNISLVCRICVFDPDPQEAGYCMAVEEIAGIKVPERAKWIRTMILELSRISSHFIYLGSLTSSLGLYTIMQWALTDRDYILDLFEMITGGRVYHIYIQPGGVRRDLPEGFKGKAEKVLENIKSRLDDYYNLIFENNIFIHRTKEVGVLNPEWALSMGVTGPNLRACGYEIDIRKDDPYLIYPEIDFDIPVLHNGDMFDRTMLRMKEIEQSIRILEQILKKMPDGSVWKPVPNPIKWEVPKGDTFERLESARGELGYYMVSDGTNKPYRVYVRGPSITHGILVLENILKGQRLADVSPILFSLDVCAPSIDR